MTFHPTSPPTKACSRCGAIKPLSAYYLRRQPGGNLSPRPHCIACHRAYSRARPTTVFTVLAIGIRKRGGRASVPALRRALGMPGSAPCYLCGEDIEPADAAVDHVIPVGLGGSHDPTNLRWTHRDCNRLKGWFLLDDMLRLAAKVMAYQSGREVLP